MREMQGSQVDDGRMRELILYLAARSEEDPRFSATKLNKLLFYCDFTAHRQLGRSITGHSYQKLQYGPAPKAMRLLLDRMKRDGDCSMVERDRFGHRQRRVKAERAPRIAVFSPAEIRLVDQIVGELWESNASEVSDLSHGFIGWRAAALREVIPYETVFVGDPSMPVSEDEAAFCGELVREA